jgi:large subunit ribosomal protein L10
LAISKERKEELVAQYTEQLQQSRGIILADYRGLSVGNVDDIRKAVRPVNGKLQVVKNRLLALALEKAGISLPEEWLIGPTAVGFCFEEVPPVAKALADAAKELDLLRIKGGFVGGSLLDTAQVKAIADLPPREVLLAQVLGTINAPAGRIAGVVASGIRQVVNVLHAYVEKLEESGGGTEQAVEAAGAA